MHMPNEMNQINCCIYSLLAILLIAGCIAYIVFSILYLIEFYDEANDCKDSHLWEYVLVSLILSTVNIKMKSDENDNAALIITVTGVINLGLSVWGAIELWTNCCSELRYSNLWDVGLASFIIQCFLVFLCVVIPPTLLCCIVINEESPSDSLTQKIEIEESPSNVLAEKVEIKKQEIIDVEV